jgi:transcriptional regulator with XRE-family HTH domain
MKEFGERLKKLRTKKHMTQDELGEIFESPKAQSTVGTWERGVRQPSMEDLVRIAQFFNVSIDYLLGISEEERRIEKFKEDNPKELKEFLNQNHILFNGAELSAEDKRRMTDILTGLFWDSFTNKN